MAPSLPGVMAVCLSQRPASEQPRLGLLRGPRRDKGSPRLGGPGGALRPAGIWALSGAGLGAPPSRALGPFPDSEASPARFPRGGRRFRVWERASSSARVLGQSPRRRGHSGSHWHSVAASASRPLALRPAESPPTRTPTPRRAPGLRHGTRFHEAPPSPFQQWQAGPRRQAQAQKFTS